MKTKNIKISKVNGKVQYLNELIPNIPTNSILCKTLTGIGATYTEIKTPRNSIIIEPNVPVIVGKCADKKHKDDNLLGVYEGIYTPDITDYIVTTQKKKKFVKILTTPESFRKVQDAFDSLDIDIRFEGYFLLFDECQKIVKDCDYRGDIMLPMDFFFECKDKAIVSATVPEFTDARFNNFTRIDITPDFDYKMNIHLDTTNNVLQKLRVRMKELDESGMPLFIFVNYTDMTYSVMKQLEILDQSAVFCAPKSVDKLKGYGFRSTYCAWNQRQMKRYNFMTSRFYSALDIELEERPNVILLTDCFAADYTMFDPYMDTVQVIGRFRNGVNAIYHITNTNQDIVVRPKSHFICRYQCDKEIYEMMNSLKNSVADIAYKEAYNSAIDILPYKRFLNENGKESNFLIDNFINEEIVKTYYHDNNTIKAAYEESGYFNVNHATEIFKIGDFEKLTIGSKTTSFKEKRMEIVRQLEILGKCETEMDVQYKRDLHFADPIIVEAYDVLGREKIEELDYSITEIRKAIIVKKHQEKSCSTDAIKLINATFAESTWYSCKDIKNKLKHIFEVLDIPHPKSITSHTIEDYFVAMEKTKKGQRGYFLLTKKFNA